MSELTDQVLERKRQKASARGMTARWAKEFGYVSILDPLTGEVHDVPTKEAPSWALNEASTRKRLWKSGRRDAYDLTSTQMNALWESDHPPLPEEEGIVEEHTEDLD
jgi:hypothetical protein